MYSDSVADTAIPQLFCNSAAIQQYRSLFVVCYTPRVFLRNEPHGHVGMDVHMDRMLLVRPARSQKPTVNAGLPSVKQPNSQTVAQLCVSKRDTKPQLAGSPCHEVSRGQDLTLDLIPMMTVSSKRARICLRVATPLFISACSCLDYAVDSLSLRL